MRKDKDGEWEWILQVKDHFSRFIWLFALKDKSSVGVAAALDVLSLSVGRCIFAKWTMVLSLRGKSFGSWNATGAMSSMEALINRQLKVQLRMLMGPLNDVFVL
jgi:hypothetical protein